MRHLLYTSDERRGSRTMLWLWNDVNVPERRWTSEPSRLQLNCDEFVVLHRLVDPFWL